MKNDNSTRNIWIIRVLAYAIVFGVINLGTYLALPGLFITLLGSSLLFGAAVLQNYQEHVYYDSWCVTKHVGMNLLFGVAVILTAGFVTRMLGI